MTDTYTLLQSMTEYYSGDPVRIQHFMKVYDYAMWIAQKENIDPHTYAMLCAAAPVHDIGIKAAEELYQKSTGKLQELLGPPLARDMLTKLQYDSDLIERVCYLAGHHHTYNGINSMDYQILVKADFLVNLYEDNVDIEGIQKAYQTIFKTTTGKELCRIMYRQAFSH